MGRHITQKSVHLKLDYTTAAWLQKWAFTDARSKNAIINDAVAIWVRLREAKSRAGMYHKQEDFAEACAALNIDPSLKQRL